MKTIRRQNDNKTKELRFLSLWGYNNQDLFLSDSDTSPERGFFL